MKSLDKYQPLLQAYADGSITRSQRFNLEKAALDDPFLFEALEGISTQSDFDLYKKVTAIAEKLKERAIIRTLIPMRWLIGAAASIALLLTAGLLFMDRSSSTVEEGTISMIGEAPESEPEIAMLTTEEKAEENISAKIEDITLSNDENKPQTKETSIEPVSGATQEKPKIDLPPTNAQPQRTIANSDLELNDVPKLSDSGGPDIASEESTPSSPSQTMSLKNTRLDNGLKMKNSTQGRTSLAISLEKLAPSASTWLQQEIAKKYTKEINAPVLDSESVYIIYVDSESKIVDIIYQQGCKECIDILKKLFKGKKMENLPSSQRVKALRFTYKSK